MNSVFRQSGLLSALSAALLLTSSWAQAQTTRLNTLMFFNGVGPSGNVTVGSDTALYGATTTSSFGTGAVGGLFYRLTPDAGAVNTIYQYGLTYDTDLTRVYLGANPQGQMLLASDSNFYGVTQSTTPFVTGGTVYRMSQGGGYAKLYTFEDMTRDDRGYLINTTGAVPQAALIEGVEGGVPYLYGMAFQGGTNGTGTIFKVKRDGTGTIQVLHAFAEIALKQQLDEDDNPVVDDENNPVMIPDTNPEGHLKNDDGVNPTARLLLASDGRLYGVTSYGGAFGTGVIFSIAVDGTDFRWTAFDISPPTITEAPADPDNPLDPNINFGKLKTNTTGSYPQGSLIQASNGKIYGTTSAMGGLSTPTTPGTAGVGGYSNDLGYGTIFSVDAANPIVINLALNFTGGENNGAAPGSAATGDLTLIDGGNVIVGTTQNGGILVDSTDPAVDDTAGAGTIYKFNVTTSEYSNVFVFGSDGTNQGYAPTSGVVAVTEGAGYAFYGITGGGGAWGQGTVFKYGLPVAHQPQGTPEPYDDGGGAVGKWLLLALVLLVMAQMIALRRRRMARIAA